MKLVNKVVILLLLCAFWLGGYWTNHPSPKLIERITTKDSIIYVKITDSSKIIKNTNRQFDIGEFKHIQTQVFKDARTLLNNMDVRLPNLSSLYHMDIATVDSGSTQALELSDTMFSICDSTDNLSLNGTFNCNTLQFDYSYKYRMKLDVISHLERTSLFKKDLRLTIQTSDRNATIQTQTFNIKHRQPKLQLGVGVGYGVFLNNGMIMHSPTLNVSIYKPIITLY